MTQSSLGCHGRASSLACALVILNTKILKSIERAAYATSAPLQDVRIDHCCRDIGMTQQLLNRANVGSAIEQMRGEAVPQRVATRLLGNLRPEHRIAHDFLYGRFMNVMPPQFSIIDARVQAQP